MTKSYVRNLKFYRAYHLAIFIMGLMGLVIILFNAEFGRQILMFVAGYGIGSAWIKNEELRREILKKDK